jgi:PAS domain S-box-containing protein
MVVSGIIVSMLSGSLRRTKISLRLSEQQLRTMGDSIPQLTWIAKADGSIVWYNQRWYQYTGTTYEQMEGWGWQSVHDPNMLPKVLDRWKESIAAAAVFEMEFPLRGADGKFRTFLTRVIPLKDSEGRVIQWCGTSTDISTHAEKEKAALNRSEQEFRSLAECMPQIVWATRPDGWNTYFNQQWVDYTGLTMEESYGHGWNKPFHPDDKHLAWEAWQRATRYNEPYSVECRLRRADGTYKWWLIRGAPMRGANGEILKWFGTCTDIDEIKHARIELEAINELLEQRVAERTLQLEQSNEELEQFASIAAHDLQEPLRMVTSFIGLLEQRYKEILDDKAKEYISGASGFVRGFFIEREAG